MPIYEFKNHDTEEVFTKFMSIAEKEEYLKGNNNIQSHFSTFPGIGDSVRLGIKQPDIGWKEVLQKIDTRSPGSTLKDHSTLTRL